ncbi:hypothetical protein CGCSCA5_v013062 [Colletotrichum siamense]|nr:hypothetical protein CGCSCA5_v013062 [Colletotrichum siamense]KAI8151660.1 hypothetical protein K4K50_010365 [Colletotrichum sp. SAR 10_71]KAI8153066.1 hypothetical protein K4K49_010435 [Colletotrichum sp. SAR 10_70]KAI8178095.1 hypothetical protein K4K51_004846 [Colletotrichum sp. SAR 10_75]KAI8207145.1 hypothetical protein K4K52_002557 [Colletotrichum sp. SAR 10_76]KAI8231994.1 hypothetical protein K4K54_012446 [Colletotrichum sp. SAR 10_86]KAJ4997974.1 hypothetical protein K4K48_006088 
MAPSSEPAPSAPKLPASADFNAIYNRISLASAKQTTFLNSMRAKYPSLARSSSSLASTSAPANNGTFSSLAKPSPAATPTTTTTSRTRVADDSDLRFENPNTGLGYAAPKSEEQASAATRDLSRRLLGKRGREVDNKTAQKRRVQEEESEEEEGRSGLGRKKKTKRVRMDEEDVPEAGDVVVPDVEMHRGDAEAGVSEARPEDAIRLGEAVVPETGEAKTKKKNKKKKKTKKVDGSV